MANTKQVNPDGSKRMPPAAGKGRRLGSVNKATKAFRETVTELLEGNSANVHEWLHTVAYGDGDQVKPDPKGALTLLAQLAEYATPKLARTEHVGNEGGPIEVRTQLLSDIDLAIQKIIDK